VKGVLFPREFSRSSVLKLNFVRKEMGGEHGAVSHEGTNASRGRLLNLRAVFAFTLSMILHLGTVVCSTPTAGTGGSSGEAQEAEAGRRWMYKIIEESIGDRGGDTFERVKKGIWESFGGEYMEESIGRSLARQQRRMIFGKD
jgi:hypothetical protein